MTLKLISMKIKLLEKLSDQSCKLEMKINRKQKSKRHFIFFSSHKLKNRENEKDYQERIQGAFDASKKGTSQTLLTAAEAQITN